MCVFEGMGVVLIEGFLYVGYDGLLMKKREWRRE